VLAAHRARQKDSVRGDCLHSGGIEDPGTSLTCPNPLLGDLLWDVLARCLWWYDLHMLNLSYASHILRSMMDVLFIWAGDGKRVGSEKNKRKFEIFFHLCYIIFSSPMLLLRYSFAFS
jgi:hypothetical protein